jgi:hypothetical protein
MDVNIAVFWDVTLCSLVDGNRCFGETCYVYLRDEFNFNFLHISLSAASCIFKVDDSVNILLTIHVEIKIGAITFGRIIKNRT